MRTTKAKKFLTLLATLAPLASLATPIAVRAWERGQVERFATLPAGEAHAEGICTDRQGNVYVVTVAADKPDTSGGTLLVFDPNGKHLRTVTIAASTPWLLDLRFHPHTGQLLVVDYKAAKVLSVDPNTGASYVFMTVTGEKPGLDGLTIDHAGNVYVTDAHEGIIWKVGSTGGAGTAWVKSPLLKPTRPPPPIGANGLAFNNKQTALFVANTAQDTIVKIPVTGSTLEPGTPDVFVNRAGGGPDGVIIDEHDNLWIACNQSNEVMVLEPTQGRVIAKLGDFGGIDKDGAPIGFLWSNSLVFHGDDVLVTNLSLDIGAYASQSLRSIDGPWAEAVKLHTVSKIKKHIPIAPKLNDGVEKDSPGAKCDASQALTRANPMSRCTFLTLVALYLTWIGAARVLGQTSNPSASEQPADSKGEVSSNSMASQPVPFGGPWNSRPKLTGDWFGLREQLRDHGITFDISATTYYQGVASGGLDDNFEFGGRNDYLLNVDGQKAGLGPGFFVNLHGETVYGDSVNLDTGAVVPVNIGRAHPVFTGNATALTNVKFTQALSENFVLYAGKINTIDNVQQPFMPGRGLDAGFMDAAFVWNPILGRTMNYSTFGAGAAFLEGGYPVATITAYDTNDDSTTSVFNNLFDNGAIIYPTLSLPTKFFGMPGHQSVWGAYSSGKYTVVTPQSLNLIPQGLSPTTEVTGSWWITYLFDQVIWVDPADQTRNWGVFGNFGISDGDANPINWSAILGVGGSSPIPGRKLDTFGIAYYYLGFSDNFKEVASTITPVRDEHGLELFYNVNVTPWCHVTTDLQVITPLLDDADIALVLGLRAKIDF